MQPNNMSLEVARQLYEWCICWEQLREEAGDGGGSASLGTAPAEGSAC